MKYILIPTIKYLAISILLFIFIIVDVFIFIIAFIWELNLNKAMKHMEVTPTHHRYPELCVTHKSRTHFILTVHKYFNK